MLQPALRPHLLTRWALAALAATALGACSDDGGGGGGDAQPAPDGTLIAAENLDAAVTATEATDRENAAIAIAERARVGTPPAGQTGEQNLVDRAVGVEGTINFDLNQDGVEDEIYTFTKAVDQVTFLAWDFEDVCHLAWNDGEESYQLQTACGGASGETIVCKGVVEPTCNICRTGSPCEPCEIDEARIDCPEPEVIPEPENNAPTPCDPPCEEGQTCVSGECVDVSTPNNQPGPVTEGMCEGACLEQSGAVCCTQCGCDAAILCQPVCPEGFLWDCEIGCCFDYDTLACDE